MIAKAEVKYIQLSPTKMRQVVDLIRNKDVVSALTILRAVSKRPKEHLLKILKSAVANAKVKGLNEDQLYISKIICNPGPIGKRFKAAAFGRASPILRRTSHIRIELDVTS